MRSLRQGIGPKNLAKLAYRRPRFERRTQRTWTRALALEQAARPGRKERGKMVV